MSVISIQGKLNKRREKEEEDWFRFNVLPFLTHEQKLMMLNAIKNKDGKTVKEIVDPILIRNEIRRRNKRA